MEDCTESHQTWNEMPPLGDSGSGQAEKPSQTCTCWVPGKVLSQLEQSEGIRPRKARLSAASGDGTVSGGSCGKDTYPAHLARSQPGVGTQCAHVGYPVVNDNRTVR